jgi:phosphoribosyl 1,2-cyclic phosphodiesterase
MKDLRVFSLYSGSGGNAFLIVTPNEKILIDAGKSARSLSRAITACGVDPSELDAIFITHEHTDHISALPVFLKKNNIPVHLPVACACKLEGSAAEDKLCPHPPICEVEIGRIHVRSFPTPHDSRASCGYRLEIPAEDGVFRLGFATDIGYVSDAVEDALTGCHAVILESNHDPEMLQNGPYPYDLKRRISSRRGHLSNPDSACFASRLARSGMRSVMLAHLSRENNTPQTAYDEYLSTLAGESVRITLTDPDEIVEMDLED